LDSSCCSGLINSESNRRLTLRFPTEQSNDIIKLREAAEAKIQAFIEMLGADAQLLTDGEEIKSHDLFNALIARRTVTGEDDEQESELEYLQLIRTVRDEQPQLFERIKRLPKKARAGRIHNPEDPALLTYFRKGRIEKFFTCDLHGTATELDFFAAVRRIECETDTHASTLGSDFYRLLDCNKQAFELATFEETPGHSSSKSRDTGAKLLQRLRAKEIRRFQGFTEEDEEFIQHVVRLLEDGAIPRPTLKKVGEAFRTESNPLKLLGIMRRDIPSQLFQPVRADSTRHNFNPRQVILSEYFGKA
jgi:hypothetical protein